MADDGSDVPATAQPEPTEPDIPDDRDPLPTVRSALRAVRREAFKARLVYALVDAALVAATVTALLAAVEVATVPETVTTRVPGVIADLLRPVTGTTGDRVTVSGPVVAALAVGTLILVVEVAVFSRRDPIRWFERANPDVAEALRTARDAAADGSDDVMAADLYRDVLARLRESSGVALLEWRRLALRLGVVALLILGATQAVALGLSIDLPGVGPDVGPPDDGSGPDPGDGGVPPPGGGGDGDGGLRPGEDVLGDPTDVPRGEIPDDVAVDPGGGSGPDDRPYETGGFPSGAVDVAAESAGFAPPAELEDAELVREYAIAIRTNATGGGGQ